MIRIEITCDHSTENRARDAKHPCDSTRGRPLCVDAIGTMDEATKAVKRIAEKQNWHRIPIAAIGRRLGFVCNNCYRRFKGEI